MAKKIVSDETKTEQKYYVTRKALWDGYYHENIDGNKIGISKGHYAKDSTGIGNKNIPVFGSVIEFTNEVIEGDEYPVAKPTGKNYFENLSPLAVHLLYVANVIVLNEEQLKAYKSWMVESLYVKKKK